VQIHKVPVKTILFRSALLFDGDSASLRHGDLLVSDGVINDITYDRSEAGDDLDVIDCEGRFLMPGLIDAHVHVYASGLNIARVIQAPFSYVAHFAARFLSASLDRGFTTLRDVGGGDVGLASAIKDGLVERSPRFYYGGHAISQTGGHGDFRPRDFNLDDDHYCSCHIDSLAVLADGVDAVRKAVREELRRGASHIKLMCSGGVASPSDPLERCQYSDDEIRAAVDEANRAGSYVCAHCHPKESIKRAAELGVRSIEHATLVDKETADLMAQRGAFAVPTMVTFFSLLEEGDKLGLPAVSMDKLRRIGDRAISGLEIMRKAGVKMGFGTDLLGSLHVRQSEEFTLRARVLSPIDVLRSSCCVNAELLGEAGRLGCLRKGANADLLVVDGNPLKDISLLAANGRGLSVIMKAGRFEKRKTSDATLPGSPPTGREVN
jgi:imidazolonepropionase-like amidohydrolase